MEQQKNKAILFEIYGDDKGVKIIDFVEDVDLWHKLLKCNIVTTTRIKFGNKNYLIICDDEGMCVPFAEISLVDCHNNRYLYGNLLIINDETNDGDCVGITEDEAEKIIKKYLIPFIPCIVN